MPDEQQVIEEAAAPVESGVTNEETPAEQGAETPSIPKPRFDEVLNRAKAAEQKARDLEARVQTLESKPATPTPTPQIPTLEQVLALYERGQMAESVKDQWVYYHSKEAAKQEFGTVLTQVASISKAQATTADYLKAIPSLVDQSSQEFRELSASYNELLAEGHPATVVTQAKALRMTFGPLKKPAGMTATEHIRQRADTFLEGAGGGDQMAVSKDDPLKHVSSQQMNYWRSKGYTRAQMLEEAKLTGPMNLHDYRRIAGAKKNGQK